MLTNVFPTAVKVAVKEAKKSKYEQRVGAVIVKRKSIVSCGHNYSHRSVKKLHPRFQKWPNSVHAEVDCIIKARQDLTGTTIYVVRINKRGKLMNSKRCKLCFMYIVNVGIKRVYFSIDKYPYMVMENI
jgi:deoxycytidylate deaminase